LRPSQERRQNLYEPFGTLIGLRARTHPKPLIRFKPDVNKCGRGAQGQVKHRQSYGHFAVFVCIAYIAGSWHPLHINPSLR
jgi:hypothetical protein